jgi:hypothetical protein
MQKANCEEKWKKLVLDWRHLQEVIGSTCIANRPVYIISRKRNKTAAFLLT